jgi:hypothetical protein
MTTRGGQPQAHPLPGREDPRSYGRWSPAVEHRETTRVSPTAFRPSGSPSGADGKHGHGQRLRPVEKRHTFELGPDTEIGTVMPRVVRYPHFEHGEMCTGWQRLFAFPRGITGPSTNAPRVSWSDRQPPCHGSPSVRFIAPSPGWRRSITQKGSASCLDQR